MGYLLLHDLKGLLAYIAVCVIPMAFLYFATFIREWVPRFLRINQEFASIGRAWDRQLKIWAQILWGGGLAVYGLMWLISALWSQTWNACIMLLLVGGLSIGLGIIFIKLGLSCKRKPVSQLK